VGAGRATDPTEPAGKTPSDPVSRLPIPPSPPGRNLSPPERRLLLLRYQVARLSRGKPLPWRVLGDSIHTHVRAGTRLEELAAVLDLGVAQVRRIRQQHSGYDPPADRGTPRQLGEWGPIGAAAAAAGTSSAHLDRWRANAEAAGVTVLRGERRLWHRTATATWWAGLAAVAPLGRRTHRADRAEQARRLRTAGMPVAAIADQLRASVMTIRRDLRGRSEAKQLADASTQTRPGSAR
jgi:hypothetical protein